jgi:hypothetical protein
MLLIRNQILILSPTLLLLASLVSGCGPSSMASKKKTTSTVTYTLTDAPATVLSPSAGEGYRTKVQGNGYSSHSFSVMTGKTLKVRFIPGKQNTQDDGQFYQYSMLGVYLGVGSNAQPTELVYNGYGGGSAMQSSVIDLSDFIPPCASGASSCRQAVVITVSQPNSDDACLNSSYQSCPYAHVPSGHSWNGTLVIQTDDTSAI